MCTDAGAGQLYQCLLFIGVAASYQHRCTFSFYFSVKINNFSFNFLTKSTVDCVNCKLFFIFQICIDIFPFPLYFWTQ